MEIKNQYFKFNDIKMSSNFKFQFNMPTFFFA